MTTPRSLLSPEAQLVLLPYGGAGRVDEVRRLLDLPLDWEALLSLASQERSALPLWRAVRDSGSSIGAAETKALKARALVWEFKLVHLERLLFDTLEAFGRAGIDVILLKGAGAALSVYGGFSERPMYDVDLLVEGRDADAAWALARDRGWNWDARRYPKEAYQNAHHLPPLSDAFGSGSSLEVHTALWPGDHPFRSLEADLRAGAITVSANGCSFKVPRASHQLVHCCTHFAWSHRMTSHAWRTFSDVDAFISSGKVDWEELISVSKRTGADSCCYWTLRLAAAVADAPVPDDVLLRLRPSGPDFFLDKLERHFILNLLPNAEECPSVSLSSRIWELGLRRGKGPVGVPLPSSPRPKGVADRIAHHGTNLWAWLRYLRRLLL